MVIAMIRRREHRLPTAHEAARQGSFTDAISSLTQAERSSLLTTRDQKGWLPAHVAARNGNLAALRLMAAEEAGLTALTNNGLSLAHLAARGGYTNVVSFLIEKQGNAVLKAADQDGWTPAHSAARGGHTDTLRFIFDKLDDVEMLNSTNGPTLEHVASHYHHGRARIEVLECLREYGQIGHSTRTSSMSDSSDESDEC